MTKKNVLIVGGGFGGLNVATIFKKYPAFHVTIIDRNNYHLFQPLLYQVAMSELSANDIAIPIRSLFTKNKHINVLLDTVKSIDLKNNQLLTDSKKMDYDYLVLACGVTHSYFNHPSWETHAPGLKTLEQAIEIRRRVLIAFEEAEKEHDLVKKSQALTFVVIGGGPTGVEIAGAIGEINQLTLRKDFRHINFSKTKIYLLESGPRLLPSFSEKLAKKAEQNLKKLGVTIQTSCTVTHLKHQRVSIGTRTIQANTIIWAAGVKASILNTTMNVPLTKDGKIIVESTLNLSHHPNVFVIGDQAHCLDKTQKPLPGVAPVAIQQGKHAAHNILRLENKEKAQPFYYKDKGQLATVGRKTAIFETKHLKLNGMIAWLLWLMVHIYYLIGFKNRLIVFMQWIWAFTSYTRRARIIIKTHWKTNQTN